MTLVSKDESLKNSMPHIGYHILQCLQKAESSRASLVEVMGFLKKHHIDDYRAIQFALIFLHSVGAIDFRAPYLFLLDKKEEEVPS